MLEKLLSVKIVKLVPLWYILVKELAKNINFAIVIDLLGTLCIVQISILLLTRDLILTSNGNHALTKQWTLFIDRLLTSIRSIKVTNNKWTNLTRWKFISENRSLKLRKAIRNYRSRIVTTEFFLVYARKMILNSAMYTLYVDNDTTELKSVRNNNSVHFETALLCGWSYLFLIFFCFVFLSQKVILNNNYSVKVHSFGGTRIIIEYIGIGYCIKEERKKCKSTQIKQASFCWSNYWKEDF